MNWLIVASSVIGAIVTRFWVRYRWHPQCSRCQKARGMDCEHFTAR